MQWLRFELADMKTKRCQWLKHFPQKYWEKLTLCGQKCSLKRVDVGVSAIPCVACDRWFHLECLLLSETTLRAPIPAKNCCPQCGDIILKDATQPRGGGRRKPSNCASKTRNLQTKVVSFKKVVLKDQNAPKRPRGRPRKFPLTTKINDLRTDQKFFNKNVPSLVTYRTAELCPNYDKCSEEDMFGFKEECSVHSLLAKIFDNIVSPGDPSRAINTLPSCLSLTKSSVPGAEFGVFTEIDIEMNTVFGPFEGEEMSLESAVTSNSECRWQISVNREPSHYVDGCDVAKSNWLRYLSCTNDFEKLNLAPFQCEKQIFFRVTKNVDKKNNSRCIWHQKCHQEDSGDSGDRFTKGKINTKRNNDTRWHTHYQLNKKWVKKSFDERVKGTELLVWHTRDLLKVVDPNLVAQVVEPPYDDEYLYCDECQLEHHGHCPVHGPMNRIPDNSLPEAGPPNANSGIPFELTIGESSFGSGSGVFAKIDLSSQTVFGPYVGKVVAGNSVDAVTSDYCWQIHGPHQLLHCIDGSDIAFSNWMRYIKFANSPEQQNLKAFQYRQRIFYRTVKPVLAGSELFVWFCDHYAKVLVRNAAVHKEQSGDNTQPSNTQRSTKKVKRIERCYRGKRRSRRSTELNHDECNLCGTTFTLNCVFALHMMRKHSLRCSYVCQVCHQNFYAFQKLKNHQSAMNHDGFVKALQPINCEKNSSNNQQSVICGAAKTLSESESVSACKFSVSYVNAENCPRGARSLRRRDCSEKELFACAKCNSTFARIHSLYQHDMRCHLVRGRMKMHYSKWVALRKSSGNDVVAGLVRSVKAGTNSRCLVRSNPPVSKGGQPQGKNAKRSQCDLCFKEFSRNDTLVSHKRDVHKLQKMSKCIECQQRFPRLLCLIQHQKEQNHHGRETVFVSDDVDRRNQPNSNTSSTGKIGSRVIRTSRIKSKIERLQNNKDTKVAAKSEPASTVRGNLRRCLAFNSNRAKKEKLQNKKGHPSKISHRCTVCYVAFANFSNLQFHFLNFHAMCTTYQCSVCLQIFNFPRDLRTHQDALHHKGVTRAFVEADKLKIAMSLQNETGEVDVQMKTEADPRMVAKRTVIFQKKKSDLATESTKEQPFGNDQLNSKKSRNCPVCGRTFTQNQYYRLHLSRHGILLAYSCPTCDEVFRIFNNLLVHRRESGHKGINRVYIGLDGEIIDIRSTVKSNDVNNPSPENEKMVAVSSVLNSLVSGPSCQQLLDTSVEAAGEMLANEIDCCADKADSEQITFAPNSNNSSHAPSPFASEVKAFSCELCGKLFKTRANKKEHQFGAHDIFSIYKCLECQQCFDFKRQLIAHQKETAHKKCEQIAVGPNDYVNEYNLAAARRNAPAENVIVPTGGVHNNHNRIDVQGLMSRDERLRPFCCFKCGFRFKFYSSLRLHLRGVHKMQSIYTCSMCPREFDAYAALREHQIQWDHHGRFEKTVEREHFSLSSSSLSSLAVDGGLNSGNHQISDGFPKCFNCHQEFGSWSEHQVHQTEGCHPDSRQSATSTVPGLQPGVNTVASADGVFFDTAMAMQYSDSVMFNPSESVPYTGGAVSASGTDYPMQAAHVDPSNTKQRHHDGSSHLYNHDVEKVILNL